MFDFRYHVASLAAVFVALVIGILVGVGLSGRGFVDDAERSNLNDRIADLEQQVAASDTELEAAARRRDALDEYAAKTYPILVPGRLEGRRVALLFVGSVDARISLEVDRVVRDAGGMVVRLRALRVPADAMAIREAVRRRPVLADVAGAGDMSAVGAELARELVQGGRMPLWQGLADTLVEERDGATAPRADAIVVARPADPQRGPTRHLLAALYETLARSGVAAVGVDRDGSASNALPAFQRAGLSTVEAVDTAAGRLALVLVLAGSEPGSFGTSEAARDGILPSVAPLPGGG